jgi:predicted transcriptional regulator
MPIDIEEFEAGGTDRPAVPATEAVARFLASNRDAAYTVSELAADLDRTENAVSTALSRLKDRGLVRHRRPYWAITDDERRLETASLTHASFRALDSTHGPESDTTDGEREGGGGGGE